MSNKTKRGLVSGGPRGYNVGMIRDFLEHLLWEVRINHFEHTGGKGKINPELVEQLQKYQRKRNTFGLLMSNAVRQQDDNPGLLMAKLHKKLGQLRDEQVHHLEAFLPLFEEALKCASQPDKALVRSWREEDFEPEDGAASDRN